VVGLVAARLKERFGRPAFAIALEPGGIGTGSGRSITGVDLGSAVRHAVSTAADQGRRPRDGGGRDDQPDKLAPFRAYLEESAARRGREGAAARTAADRRRGLGGGANVAMLTTSRRAGPFGAGHAEPVFALPRTPSPMPRRSGRRMCARGCAQATARCSTPSRSAPPASRSATR
jgi:single-stranded-DNA-specific exonuclease